jgi:NADH-quinone oxidoreductase subunit F
MTDVDTKAIQNVLKPFAPWGRTALLPALHAVQDYYGYISKDGAAAISTLLNVPLADVFGVIEFYALFNQSPLKKTIIHVCNDPVCAMAGSESIMKMVPRLTPAINQTHDQFTVERAPCLGLCEHAPAIMIKDKPINAQDIQTWQDLIEWKGKSPQSIVSGDIRWLTKNCGNNAPTSLESYQKNGGYTSLEKALQSTPQQIIDWIKQSGLVGRGGAAFPTGIKWEGAARAPGETKYVVCNGDEAEPGTFKDRVIMEDDPHLVIEGMIINAYAIGAQKGFFYIRGEYKNAYQIILNAIYEAEQAGYLGNSILSTNFNFEIEVRRGAGAYICGEETALFESIEGKRGFPRIKPPFPTTQGLYGKPTVINNVETLSNIPIILSLGVENYRAIGSEKSPGSKLFCISGDIQKPGLYEVPFGVTLRHLIENLAGGIHPGHTIKGILIGGAAGAFASPDQLDVKLTFEDLRSADLPLGSGVITVFNETRNMLEILTRLAYFFAEESCGKCYPCQIGTQRQLEIVQRMQEYQINHSDYETLMDIGITMTDTSLCGLGQTAFSAIKSAMRIWPELFRKLSRFEEGTYD